MEWAILAIITFLILGMSFVDSEFEHCFRVEKNSGNTYMGHCIGCEYPSSKCKHCPYYMP